MLGPRGTAPVLLDTLASDPNAPHGIITVDCSNPREIDDGIAVESLDSDTELYRVRVFAVDTSALYKDHTITSEAVQKTEARYLHPQTAEEAYEPMLDEEVIRDYEFSAGHVRKALAVSFIIGVAQPPTGTEIGYGRVEVTKNFRYDKFGRKCRYDEAFRGFGRAAALLTHYLGASLGDEEQAYHNLIHVPKWENFKRGDDINSTFMVAANYLVARSFSDTDTAIFRVHDPADSTFTDFIETDVARFSTTPGPHNGLGLDRYTRITSPLRRAEDFIMHGLLRARHDGRPLNARDQRLVTATVQRLNQRIARDIFNGRRHPRDVDNLQDDQARLVS